MTTTTRSVALIACDLGAAKRSAIEMGIGVADKLGYEPTLLHVDPYPALLVEGVSPIDPVDLDHMKRDYHDRAIEELRSIVRATGRDPHAVEILIREGRAAERILETARELGAEMIVIGAEVHGAFEHLIAGHTAHRIVREAACPVLSAHGGAMWEGIRRVLFATDFEETSRPASDWAARLAASFGASLALVHVSQLGSEFAAPYVFPPTGLDTLRETLARRLDAEKRALEAAVTRHSNATVQIDTHLVFAESTARAIGRTAKTDHADLVVVGTHGRKGLARALLGSVAEGVLHHAGTSVLTVHSA
jgi:nucleotide-binding universal stress UspA family protein